MSDPLVIYLTLRSIEHELRRITDALERLVELGEARAQREVGRELAR